MKEKKKRDDGRETDLEGDIEGLGKGLSPDRAGKSKGGVVGEFDGFLGTTEGEDGEDRAKDLVDDARTGGLHVVDHGGREEETLLGELDRRLVDRGSFLASQIDVVRHPLELHLVDEGTHVDALVEGVSHSEVVHSPLDLLDHSLGDALLHEQTRTSAADLSLVVPDGVDETLDGAVKVSVIKDDERRLASQLERQLLSTSSGALAQQSSHASASREGSLVHVLVVHQVEAKVVSSRQNVHNTY